MMLFTAGGLFESHQPIHCTQNQLFKRGLWAGHAYSVRRRKNLSNNFYEKNPVIHWSLDTGEPSCWRQHRHELIRVRGQAYSLRLNRYRYLCPVADKTPSNQWVPNPHIKSGCPTHDFLCIWPGTVCTDMDLGYIIHNLIFWRLVPDRWVELAVCIVFFCISNQRKVIFYWNTVEYILMSRSIDTF